MPIPSCDRNNLESRRSRSPESTPEFPTPKLTGDAFELVLGSSGSNYGIPRIMPSHWNSRLLSRHGRSEKSPRRYLGQKWLMRVTT